MNYSQCIDYLFTKLPMFTRDGASAYKNDLTNTILLSEALGNPHLEFKSIHIAGTNGKGSTSHMLASVLQEADYKVGLYTSPHLKDFRERIKINGIEVDENWVINFVEKNKELIEKIEPSFFEITVAMAFKYFAEQQVDIAVVEVGMGGLLDSTNIIVPELSVITNIGYDHMQFLGNTLAEIAINKAGIIKKNIPVVIGETHEETEKIFTDTSLHNASKIFFADKVYECIKVKSENFFLQNFKIVHKQQFIITPIATDILGSYQAKNIATVFMAIEVLQHLEWKIDDNNILTGLKNVKRNTGLRGRFDVVDQEPLVILDVAHNEDGIKQLFLQIDTILNSKKVDYENLHIVIGFVKDKNIDKILSILPPKANYYFTQAKIPRALPIEELREKASLYNIVGNTFENVELAYRQAKEKASKHDIVLVTGSFFIVCDLV